MRMSASSVVPRICSAILMVCGVCAGLAVMAMPTPVPTSEDCPTEATYTFIITKDGAFDEDDNSVDSLVITLVDNESTAIKLYADSLTFTSAELVVYDGDNNKVESDAYGVVWSFSDDVIEIHIYKETDDEVEVEVEVELEVDAFLLPVKATRTSNDGGCTSD